MKNQPAKILVTNPDCAWRGQTFDVHEFEYRNKGDVTPTHVKFLAPCNGGRDLIRLAMADVQLLPIQS